MSYIGTPTSRIDGHAKVTGAAKYAGEHNVDGLAYAAVVASTIAKGRVARFDFDALSRLELVVLDEPQKRRILVSDARDLQRFSDWTGEQVVEMVRCDGAVGARDRVAVWVVGRPAQHFVDSLDQIHVAPFAVGTPSTRSYAMRETSFDSSSARHFSVER